jgi:hypothetical protein
MANNPPAVAGHPSKSRDVRTASLVAAIGLLLMAILAPFAQFGVLGQLIVPADAAATTRNIAASTGLFVAGIGAFVVVAILDVVVAWAMYGLLRGVDRGLARFVGWSRVLYAVGFAWAILSLAEVAQLVGGRSTADLANATVQSQVASLAASFGSRWDVALVVFAGHLFGLGALLLRSVDFPRILSALVFVAGAGYLADALGRLFLPGYSLTISMFTFIGEALLIVWLFRIAIKGSRATPAGAPGPAALGQPSGVAAS